jgi:superfamily II DNA or RNA helicase/HKD family nuclease
VSDLAAGLYERLLTEALEAALGALGPRFTARRAELAPAEAPDRIAWHLGREVQRALSDLPEADRVTLGTPVARELLRRLAERVGAEPDLPLEPGEVLHAVLRRLPSGDVEQLPTPLTPLLDTTLLTNAPGEPNLWSQLRSEIPSAEGIDLVMAFIRRSGITPLVEPLRRHCEAGRPLRVLTTTYTGSTEGAALDVLADLGADVRVSYELGSTRLHAKAWVFHRPTGFSTAYVGSSNLTQAAQVAGLEWNVRVSEARNPDVVAKVAAVFDAYWASDDFVPFDPDEFDAQRRRASGEERDAGPVLPPVELQPRPFQVRLLELLEVSRARGHHRNLLVAATGTGKTVMAALDYARLRKRLPRDRLLFVAHRAEILDQSLATFRLALCDPTFGERWVGGERPRAFSHVFASIQSLHAADFDLLDPEHFDVVIIDEFHHAAAPSYQRLLGHLRPRELLGLTATPERSDGLPVLSWFDDRIAAELRLWDAIDQQVLVPFLYYGVHDGLDLRAVPWRRGHGYDVAALSDVYTSSEAWARLVVQQVRRFADVQRMRALGFAVSVAHAQFLARHFSAHGIPAVAVSGTSPATEREQALADLAAGRVRVVFSVDLFNEGVDVPAVDTLLLLRPTESPTVFIQQLGRGLRRAPGKSCCVVLDLVGLHRREFRFDRRFRALLGGTRRDVEHAVRDGFPYLPSGCSMQLDRVATEVVLRSLRDAIPSRWPAKVEELASLRRTRGDVDLATFLVESGLDLTEVYDGGRSWSDLREAAGASVRPAGPHERALRRAVGRLDHLDDEERLDTYRRHLGAPAPPDLAGLPERERRLLRMLVAQVAERVLRTGVTLADALALIWAHPQVRDELHQLVTVLADRVDHLHRPLTTHPDVPLQVHARYSRIEILAACGIGTGDARVPP